MVVEGANPYATEKPTDLYVRGSAEFHGRCAQCEAVPLVGIIPSIGRVACGAFECLGCAAVGACHIGTDSLQDCRAYDPETYDKAGYGMAAGLAGIAEGVANILTLGGYQSVRSIMATSEEAEIPQLAAANEFRSNQTMCPGLNHFANGRPTYELIGRIRELTIKKE